MIVGRVLRSATSDITPEVDGETRDNSKKPEMLKTYYKKKSGAKQTGAIEKSQVRHNKNRGKIRCDYDIQEAGIGQCSS